MKHKRNELPPEHYNASNYLERRNKRVLEELEGQKRAIEEIERRLSKRVEDVDFDKEKKIHHVNGRVDQVNTRVDKVEVSVEKVNVRVDAVETRVSVVEGEVAKLYRYVDQKVVTLKEELTFMVDKSHSKMMELLENDYRGLSSKMNTIEFHITKGITDLGFEVKKFVQEVENLKAKFANDVTKMQMHVDEAYRKFDHAKNMLEGTIQKWLFSMFERNENVALQLNQKKLEIEAVADKTYLALKDIELAQGNMALYYEKKESEARERRSALERQAQDNAHKQDLVQRKESELKTKEEAAKARLNAHVNEQKRKIMEAYVRDLEKENEYLAQNQIPIMLDGNYNLVGPAWAYGLSDAEANRRVAQARLEKFGGG